MMQGANKISRANHRCASPLKAVRQFGHTTHSSPSLSLAVAQF